MLFTPNLWNIQRDCHTLAATQEVPRHTRLHSRGSTRVPPTSRGAPFLPPSSRGGILSLRDRERIPGLPIHLKRRRSPKERREELQGRATIPRVPQMSQSIPGKTVFPNGLSHLGDSGNGGRTLEFLSPFLWRAPALEMRRERREFFPDHAGNGSLLSS